MGITKVGGYIRVLYESGDAKGNSEANPYTLDDVLAADVANGWGNVTKRGNIFTFDGASLHIYGTTYFTIYKEDLQFLNITESYVILSQTYGLLDVQYMSLNYEFSKYLQLAYKCYMNSCWINSTYRIHAYGTPDYTTTIRNTTFVAPQIIYVNND